MTKQRAIPLISSRTALLEATREQISNMPEWRLAELTDELVAAEYLSVEMPALTLLDFADPDTDAFALVEDLSEDPWLLRGGIVAIYATSEQARSIAAFSAGQIIIALHEQELTHRLSVVLSILGRDDQLCVQRHTGLNAISQLSASFTLSNDVIQAVCYSGIISHFLFAIGCLNASAKQAVQTTLQELLLNAIEHGNCDISNSEKAEWLAQGHHISELIACKLKDPARAGRQTFLQMEIADGDVCFTIRDEGDGFDWRSWVQRKPEDASTGAMNGRGLMMAQFLSQDLQFNDAGNEVTLRFSLDGASLPIPPLLQDMPRRQLEAGYTLFAQGDWDDRIYFIVRGRFQLTVDEVRVAELDERDLVIGEMSFLLNGPRGASVHALTDSEVIEVSRRQFMDAIRVNPHYAMTLCRLLAERLARQNERLAN